MLIVPKYEELNCVNHSETVFPLEYCTIKKPFVKSLKSDKTHLFIKHMAQFGLYICVCGVVTSPATITKWNQLYFLY